MEVSHEMQDDQECSEEGATFEVGVFEEIDKYSKENIKKGTTKKWVYSGPARKVSNVFLNLDMEKNLRKFCLAGEFWLPRRSSVLAERRFTFGDSIFLYELSAPQSNNLQNRFILGLL